jgi:predicted nucleic acid-binding protein
MKVAVDSSSLAKRYVREVGSDQLEQFLQSASELAFCVILVPEIVSGLNRRRREGVLTDRDYRAAKHQLLDDVRDATVLQITPSVVSHSVKLLESNTLRALDALHLACAIQWQADLFVTSDRRQWQAAAEMDLPTEYVGS